MSLTLEKLYAEHPELVKAIEDGVTARAKQHIGAGRDAGALELACTNIENGVDFGAEAFSGYLAAAKRTQTAQSLDTQDLEGEGASTPDPDQGKQPSFMRDALAAAKANGSI